MKKKRTGRQTTKPKSPEILFDRIIAIAAPSNFSELVAIDPEGPEIQKLLNAALDAADLAQKPAPRRVRASKRTSSVSPPPEELGSDSIDGQRV
jgi:hypothetical protein